MPINIEGLTLTPVEPSPDIQTYEIEDAHYEVEAVRQAVKDCTCEVLRTLIFERQPWIKREGMPTISFGTIAAEVRTKEYESILAHRETARREHSRKVTRLYIGADDHSRPRF